MHFEIFQFLLLIAFTFGASFALGKYAGSSFTRAESSKVIHKLNKELRHSYETISDLQTDLKACNNSRPLPLSMEEFEELVDSVIPERYPGSNGSEVDYRLSEPAKKHLAFTISKNLNALLGLHYS